MLSNKIKKIIDKSEIVSFDIFDTLIERMVSTPSNVFDVVQEKYNNTHKERIHNFKKIRIECEYDARINSKSEEITIEEIYQLIAKKYKKIDIKELMNIELQTEKKVCRLKKENFELIEYCYKKNKKIIVTSDMYLPKNIIEEILKENNIKYSKLYLSSEILKTKSTGSLYKSIINDNNIIPNKIVHIGDNIKSDYLMPKVYKIKSLLLKNKKIKNYNNIMVDYALLCSINDLDKDSDYFYNFGYKYLGIIMLCFCKFLRKEIKNNKKLIFLSREGQFMKKCYDELYPDNNSQYMFVSRKSVSSALLYYYDDIKKMKDSQSLSPKETIETFLKRWDIINKETLNLLKENNIDIEKRVFATSEEDKLQKLLNILKEKSNAKEKNQKFNKYLEQLGVDKNTVIVDIGWSGTMQDLLQRQLSENNIVIEGYYMGVRSKKKNQLKHGFLFDGEGDSIEILSRSMTGFLEVIFSANHGTTLGYKEKNKNIEPVLAKNDISDIELSKIIEIQNGCIDFIKKYRNDDIFELYNCYKKSYIPLFDYCINPKLKDINKFDEFKVIDEKEYSLIGNKYGLKYCFHPKAFVNDYILSCWKNAYLKSIFKLKLPYSKIFEFAYKRRS